MPLYNIENPYDRAMSGMGIASGTLGRSQPGQTTTTKASPTVGGGIGSAASGGIASSYLLGEGGALAETGAALTEGMEALGAGATLFGVGALIGLAAYLLS